MQKCSSFNGTVSVFIYITVSGRPRVVCSAVLHLVLPLSVFDLHLPAYPYLFPLLPHPPSLSVSAASPSPFKFSVLVLNPSSCLPLSSLPQFVRDFACTFSTSRMLRPKHRLHSTAPFADYFGKLFYLHLQSCN